MVLFDEDDAIDEFEDDTSTAMAYLERRVGEEKVSRTRALEALEDLRAHTNRQIARLAGNCGPAYADTKSGL